jgi:cyanophycinase
VTGPLLLSGGDEFRPAYEDVDRELLAQQSVPRSVHVVLAGAARQDPEQALTNARRHFDRLGAEAVPVDALTPAQANRPAAADQVKNSRFCFVAGGDPGYLLRTLRGSLLWSAMLESWTSGGALAGSSAGAMVLGQWCLLRRRWPNPVERRLEPALNLVPGLVLVPHLETMGRRWLPGVLNDAPPGSIVLGIDAGTAVLWNGQDWEVRGGGMAERFSDGREQAASQGQGIELPEPRLPVDQERA